MNDRIKDRIIFFINPINKYLQALALRKWIFFLFLDIVISDEWKKGRKIESIGKVVRWLRAASGIGGLVFVSVFLRKLFIHFEIELSNSLFDRSWIRPERGFDKIVKVLTKLASLLRFIKLKHAAGSLLFVQHQILFRQSILLISIIKRVIKWRCQVCTFIFE